MTIDWGATPQWVGIYVGAVLALYFGTRYEMSVIRSAGDRFQDAFATKVRDLQHIALTEITKGFGTDYPTLKKLIQTPPKAPEGDLEEDELRKDFETASEEVEGVGSKLEAVKHPDDLFSRARAAFESKAMKIHRVVLAAIVLSLVIPTFLLIETADPSAQLGGVAFALGYIALFPGGYVVIEGYRCWNLSEKLDRDKKELESEVNEKVNRIRKVGARVETPPKEPP